MKAKKVRSDNKLIGLLILVIVVLLGFTGWYALHSKNSTEKTLSAANKETSQIKQNPYAGWKTYEDTGYASASGVTIKYPAGWKLEPGSNAVAWELVQVAAPKAIISSRVIFLDSSQTPKQEWNNCPSADACGPSPDDSLVSESDLTIGQLAAYRVQEKRDAGTYYTTVVKGSKAVADGTPFVEFTVNNPNAQTLSVYEQIVKTAHF